jgi:protein-L-isoaspartate(D-aspartate) O-methyltransferase
MRRWIVLVAALVAACDGAAPLPPVTDAGGIPSTAPVPVTAAAAGATTTNPSDDRAEERNDMVDAQIEARNITSPAVIEAMRTVPRHRFVPDDLARLAYADSALPIGYGQTISQPYIVGLMTQALEVGPGDRVLEIGTGSGYQAAILAAMGCEVYTMEIIPELATSAVATLNELGYEATVANADGYYGWEEHAPYDGIIVTAAPDHVPQPLIQQLNEDAALVIPIGPIGAAQTLWRFTVDDEGSISGENLGGVLFVPFTRATE